NVVVTPLGSLHAGSSSTQLANLVQKWFLGDNLPVSDVPYDVLNGYLFQGSGPVYKDVQQGQVGDCWLEASLAETAARRPDIITSMFIWRGANVVNDTPVSV